MASTMNWLQQAETIAHHFGKGKEAPGNDGSWMTLCPAHGDSSKPNLHVTPAEDRILLYCHACGDTNKPELIKLVSAEFQLSDKVSKSKPIPTLKKSERGQWINPIPANSPARPNDCYLNQDVGRRTVDMLWSYLNPNKEVMLYNARFNIVAEDGVVSKEYRRLALYAPLTGPLVPTWSWYGPDASLPLYGLEQLVDEWWTKPLILVEGEKSADAARETFPEAVVIAFPGGAGHFKRIDWAPLLGAGKVSSAILWPDNDKAGRIMAHSPNGLSAYLAKQNVRVRVVPVFDVPDLPEKWDLADPLPPDWDRNSLTALLDKAVYAEVADATRVSRYCGTLAGMDITVEEFMAKSHVPCATLSKDADALCLRCPQFGRISQPADLTFIPDIQLDWVYLTKHKVFHNVRTQEVLDHQGFNAHWASDPSYTLSGPACATNAILTDDNTSLAYEYGYQPNGPAMIVEARGQRRLNIWTGFALEPDYVTEPTVWLALGDYLIKDKGILNHIYDWLAYLVQYPEKKINHGMLLISNTQGVGKDSFIEPIREIFGPGNCQDISSRSLDSQFNEYLLQTKLLVISELDTIGHRSSTYDYMKPLLAAPPMMLNINVKIMKQIEVPNLVQVIAFSNKEVPVSIEENDRRLLVYDIQHTPEQRWGSEKFDDYYRWRKAGGARQVFGWLMKRDVSAFDASAPAPGTEAKRIMAEGSVPALAFLADMLRNVAPPFHADLVSVTDIIELLKQSAGKTRIGAFERFMGKYDAGRIPMRVRVDKVRVQMFACRHFGFWSKQSEDTLRRAYKGQYYDMAPLSATDQTPGDTPKVQPFEF